MSRTSAADPNPIDAFGRTDALFDMHMGIEDARVATLIDLMRSEIEAGARRAAPMAKRCRSQSLRAWRRCCRNPRGTAPRRDVVRRNSCSASRILSGANLAHELTIERLSTLVSMSPFLSPGVSSKRPGSRRTSSSLASESPARGTMLSSGGRVHRRCRDGARLREPESFRRCLSTDHRRVARASDRSWRADSLLEVARDMQRDVADSAPRKAQERRFSQQESGSIADDVRR